jgi:hypothetical protein
MFCSASPSFLLFVRACFKTETLKFRRLDFQHIFSCTVTLGTTSKKGSRTGTATIFQIEMCVQKQDQEVIVHVHMQRFLKVMKQL